MAESVFSKVYSYREKENQGSKENFLTEIFAHCLQTDEKLLNGFLSELNLQPDDEASIKTQSIYEFGRPDIEINLPKTKTCILIECKIEHFERQNQLEDYKKILIEKKVSKRHLVYLTKYYFKKENSNKSISLHLKKWADIFEIIDENNTQLSNELKSFIKDENMAESKNFTYGDLGLLTQVSGTISKMNEVIDGITEYYDNKIGPLSKRSARSTKMEDESYSTFHFVEKSNKFRSQIDIGFMWWENAEVNLGVQIWLSKAEKYKETTAIFKLLKKYLIRNNWEVAEYEDAFTIGFYEPVSRFINDVDEQIPAMVELLKECVDELALIKKVDSRIFK